MFSNLQSLPLLDHDAAPASAQASKGEPTFASTVSAERVTGFSRQEVREGSLSPKSRPQQTISNWNSLRRTGSEGANSAGLGVLRRREEGSRGETRLSPTGSATRERGQRGSRRESWGSNNMDIDQSPSPTRESPRGAKGRSMRKSGRTRGRLGEQV